VIILVVIITLACIGASIVIKGNNNEKEKEETSKILLSGKYSIALIPATQLLSEKKPSKAQLEEWLNSQSISEDQKTKYLEIWQNSLDETIKTINEGDINEVKTFQIVVGPKSKNICHFLPSDNFITRDQITKNAEILPPYFFGCDCSVIPKLPTGNDNWQPVASKDGIYDVPDWRQMV
jgi:hypothetical protein